MGASIGWVLIQTSPDKFTSEQIMKDLFSLYSLEEKEINLKQLKKEQFTPRKSEFIQIFKTNKFLGISNIPLAESFFNTQNNAIAYRYYKYFGKPKLIFVILENDSPSDYGYCIIKDGSIKRFYLSQDGSYKILEFGERNEIELDWFNAIKESRWDEVEGMDMGTLTNLRTKETIQIHSLSTTLLADVVKYFTGRTTWDFDEIVTERRYFRILEKSDFKLQKFENTFINASKKKKIVVTVAICISYFLYLILKIYFSK